MKSTLAILAALLALAIAPPAWAGSIVFIKDSNVWIANDDGSGQRQVTSDGTADDAYSAPSQADDGTIVALKDNYKIHRLRQNGEPLNEPFTPPAGRATDLALAPDGAKIAVNRLCGTGTSLTRCVEYSTPDSGEFAGPAAGGFYRPAWLDSGTAVMTVGSSVWTHVFGSSADPVTWWGDSDHGGSEPLDDIDIAPGRVVLVRGTPGSEKGSTLQTYSFTSLAEKPTPACTLSGPTAGADGEARFVDPTFSPDGSAIAWQEGNGIWIATGFPAGGCPAGLPEAVAIPGGSEPDWGPAANAPGPATGSPTGGGTARLRLGTALRQGIKVPVACASECEVTVKLTVDARTARKYKLGRRATVVGSRTVVMDAGLSLVTVKFTRKARTRLKRAGKLTLTLAVETADAESNVDRSKTKLTLRR